ncbi:NACHT domain-containing protein [Streptomyces cyaneus]|uniref:NACHT domain-containing protein n=1 Tax=Streptomyces cyaneus TaxID=1904 RepID=UPI000FF8A9E1|nr:NACHT domain-containing protein [Streptomyces cyaneus]
MAEIVTAALGIVGKLVAKPASEAALRKERVVQALKTLRLDPHVPPQDFDSLYAYTLVEYCADRPTPVLAVFRDEYVMAAFRRSFGSADGWRRLREEVLTAVERNRETGEFGRLDHGFVETHVEGFATAFQALVDRSRAPHETRLEQKVDALLEQVSRTRDEEESHRARTEPGRAALSPAERLMEDARDWFLAVGYRIERTWETADDSVALLVHVPQRRPGRFDVTVMLCVEGELQRHHLEFLDRLVRDEAAAEGWGLARTRVSEAARRFAKAGDDRLFCYTFDELIELEADFEPYIAWVEEEVRRRGVDVRYVPLSCRKDEIDPATQQHLDTSVYDWREGGLDDYVAGWLEDPTKKHLSLLGEFGMGKSWFALHLAGEMARGWRDAKRRGVPRPRIPLLIPLRDYAKQTSVEALLSEFFFNKHKINLRSYDVFRVLNRMRRLLLIFDGFDEMAARVDHNTVVANFWELAKAVEPGAKVLLSSRTEHFPDAQVAREVFGAKASASVRREEGPTFEIVELVPFDDEQIERMLGHVLTEDKVRTVMDNEEVRDLMRRPVMSELVIDALPEIEQGAEIDLARIYLYAIQRKMDRDIQDGRTFTSRADKVYFLCEVAWEMLSSDRLSLNYRDFPDRLKACFGTAVESAKALDYWDQDMRGQGMLVRNAEGDYGPSHKSLVEFLVAFKFAAELGLLSGDFLGMMPKARDVAGAVYTWADYFAARSAEGELPALRTFGPESLETLCQNFGSLGLNEVVYQFLAAMVRQHPDVQKQLLDVIGRMRQFKPTSGTALTGNCANLVLASGGSLEGADLSEVDLGGFLPLAFVPTASLAGAVLRGSELGRATLADVDLSGADFTRARVVPSTLVDSLLLQGGLAHSSGAVVLRTASELWHWPDGDVAGEPLRIPTEQVRDTSQRAPVFWDEDTWAFVNGSDWSLVDAKSGQIIGSAGHRGDFPLRWRGRTVLGEWESETLTVLDPESGEVIDAVRKPDLLVSEFYFSSGRGGLGALTVGQSKARHLVLDDASHWLTVAEIAAESLREWMVWSAHDDALLCAGGRMFGAVDSAGLRVVFYTAGVPVPEWTPRGIKGFVYRAASGMAAMAVETDLYLWRPADTAGAGEWETVAWLGQRHTVPAGTAALWSPPAGDRLVVLSRMGELTVLDFRTGEILSRRMLTTRFKGTRFSRFCGYDDATLEALTRAGAVIVDDARDQYD